MTWTVFLGAGDYEIARQVLQRGTAAVFAVAFWSTAAQFPALLGERGLMPARQLLAHPRLVRTPTIFRLHYSDRMLRGVCASGIALALAVVAGLPQLGPPWLPLAVFLLLWVAYLSVIAIGQTFYGFGWEMLLVEAGFTIGFLGSDSVPPPWPILVAVWWLVFRLEFGAGMIKLRGGREWRDLTALDYHHETQPMPNPASRFAHLLPRRVHRIEVVGNHVAQLIVPFLLFVPGPVGAVAAAVVVLTQLWLVVTGNFAWLNVLTVVLACSAIPDSAFHAVLPFVPEDLGAQHGSPVWWSVTVLAASVLFLLLAIRPARNLLSHRQLMNASFNALLLGNAYGAFGTVTRERYEIVVEGTLDEATDPDAQWREYAFKGKPGDVSRTPRQFAPYHLRLDWMMWFLALGSPGERWFTPFLERLLEADRPTLKLLRADPFGGGRPRFVRARVYRYRFATRAQRRATGQVWMREPAGTYARPRSLQR